MIENIILYFNYFLKLHLIKCTFFGHNLFTITLVFHACTLSQIYPVGQVTKMTQFCNLKNHRVTNVHRLTLVSGIGKKRMSNDTKFENHL